MKKIYRPLIKGTNWALAGLLTLLGFSGCTNDKVEYGTPYAEYTIEGTVTNEAGEPVPDIKIETTAPYAGMQNPALSNESGHYSAKLGSTQTIQVIASDIDGEKNGAYQNDTIQVAIDDSDYYDKGDGHWYDGAARKEVNITLLKINE
ncbi:MAG: radical SAM-associated putative lipoprotein [Tannerella sp.]|jgi:putative lipoprotein (rSAM/lipoprotein system)|nr:radical SAM-associated putative lipoprotein [Tannerella sp.]